MLDTCACIPDTAQLLKCCFLITAKGLEASFHLLVLLLQLCTGKQHLKMSADSIHHAEPLPIEDIDSSREGGLWRQFNAAEGSTGSKWIK